MYFPFGWPKYLHLDNEEANTVKYLCCNRDRSLFSILNNDRVAVWFAKPCVRIVSHQRSQSSIETLGANKTAEWKPDSTMLVITTTKNCLLFYHLDVTDNLKGLYEQHDSKVSSLKRDSAELFMGERIPPLVLVLSFTMQLPARVTGLVCIRDELMVATDDSRVMRVHWDGTIVPEFSWSIYRVPLAVDQQLSRAVLLGEPGLFVQDIEYSPLIGGFSLVLSNGRAAFVTAATLQFDPDQIQGIWAQEISNASCTAINHRYRLIVYGLDSSDGAVYSIDDLTGALVPVHRLVLSSKDFPDVSTAAGAVICLRWSPDGSSLAMAWEKGGLALWSVFGTLLVCTLGWDYGLTDVMKLNPFKISSLDWGVEGYHLWLVTSKVVEGKVDSTGVALMQFAKSSLTVNAGMTGREHVFLQAEDRLFLGTGMDNPSRPGPKKGLFSHMEHQSHTSNIGDDGDCDENYTHGALQAHLVGNKQWVVVAIPYSYLGNNWPVRYASIDPGGQHIVVAGRTGLAHYSLPLKKWKLFGNESQEQDFVVMGGLLWWQDYVIVGCYNLRDCRDEIRIYPKGTKLDNEFVRVSKVPTQVLQLSLMGDKLLSFCADSHLTLFHLQKDIVTANDPVVSLTHLLELDVSRLVVHPACVVSATLTSLRTDSGKRVDSILMNVCGKLFLLQQDPAHKSSQDSKNNNSFSTNTNNNNNNNNSGSVPMFSAPTILASSVENVWTSSRSSRHMPHLTEALWINCGAHGMRVWLPLFPRDGENTRSHNFMSKRIMLPVQVPIYPLAVLFEETMVLGAENDTLFCTVDNSVCAPLSIISRSSQVYLHHILRQLLRRNLGYHAWEIARSCSELAYFAHSLELLLHEVLEEEATSSEPIPDALLPRVIDFIREFPVYLQTIVQCARKTELALWPHLFSAVGNPKDLFQECLERNCLDTAASYLIILQSMESSTVSRQLATLLLDATLDGAKWELSKELVRFLRAIDPSDVESPPRASTLLPLGTACKFPVSQPCEEDLSLVLGTVSLTRGRSFSSGNTPKLSSPTNITPLPTPEGTSLHRDLIRMKSEPKNIPPKRKLSSPRTDVSSAEEFFIDLILMRHARKLLTEGHLKDLGLFAAHLDFHLISFFRKERSRAAHVEDFITALRGIHQGFHWPFPALPVSLASNLPRKLSGSSFHSDCFEESLKPLVVTLPGMEESTRIGDSGYISHFSREGSTAQTTPSLDAGHQSIDAHLLPRRPTVEEESLLTLEPSEESSLWGGDEGLVTEDSVHSTSFSWSSSLPLSANLEAMTLELASKGPPQAEIQLRYLLQLLLEAGCLEWALVLAVVLRDAMAVVRVVNSAQQPDLASQELVQQLRSHLTALDHWADTQCLGYKPFVLSIRNQVKVLTRLSVCKRQTLKLLQSGDLSPSSPSQDTSKSCSTSSSCDTQTPTQELDQVINKVGEDEVEGVGSGENIFSEGNECSTPSHDKKESVNVKEETVPKGNDCAIS